MNARVVVSCRGRNLLDLCSNLQLVILNGSCSIPGSHTGFTSFQRKDDSSHRSIIDLALVSLESLSCIIDFTVQPHNRRFSDHSEISLSTLITNAKKETPADSVSRRQYRIRRPSKALQRRNKILATLWDDSSADDSTRFVNRLLRDMLDEQKEINLHEQTRSASESRGPKRASAQVSSHRKFKADLRAAYIPHGNHRGRSLKRYFQKQAMASLKDAACSGPASLWKAIKSWTYAQPIPPQVSLTELYAELADRMNPPLDTSSGFSPVHRAEDDAFIALIPMRTTSVAVFPFLDEDLTTEDIAKAKVVLSRKASSSAPGIDGMSYSAVSQLDSDALCGLLNECFSRRVVPIPWLTAVITGIPKRGKDPANAKSYRAIALEPCLLKFAETVICAKFNEAINQENLVPLIQGGFRTGTRTDNNLFILRTLIDLAVSKGEHLYAAFVDVSNAFPSTDQKRLWIKMQRLGLTGQYFDWIRTLYSMLRYRVRQNQEFSPEFQALMGVLAGSPLSPTLWSIFLSDLEIPVRDDDFRLMAIVISCLLFADDIMLTSKSPEGLQAHLNAVATYCRRNYLILNTDKSWVMILNGELPLAENLFLFSVDGRPIRYTDRFKYLGVWITSTHKDYFHLHCEEKVRAARNACYSIFRLELFLGRNNVPPDLAKELYTALVDSHLIHGADVMPHISKKHIDERSNVQIHFLRKMLQLDSKCMIAPLFTETGVLPSGCRCIKIVLRFLSYAMALPPLHPVNAALLENHRLREAGCASWLNDLAFAIQAETGGAFTLPSLSTLSAESVHTLSKNITDHRIDDLHRQVQQSTRLVLLHGRKEPCSEGQPKLVKLQLRHYLVQVVNSRHRAALTRLLFGSHIFRSLTFRAKVVGSSLCRMGCAQEETPQHALLQCCRHPPTLPLRRDMLNLARVANIPVPLDLTSDNEALALLRSLIFHWDLVIPMARFVYHVSRMWSPIMFLMEESDDDSDSEDTLSP